MVLTNSLGELMARQMLQYYQIVLNIYDCAYIYIYIYIYYMLVSVTLGFMLSAFVREKVLEKKTD